MPNAVDQEKVVISGLYKIFDGHRNRQVVALQDVNLSIQNGQFVVIVGPSGCGKTTLIRRILVESGEQRLTRVRIAQAA